MALEWLPTIYNSFIVAGCFIILCTVGTASSSSLTGTIVGYSFIITGIALLIGVLMNQIKMVSMISIAITLGPFLILLGILIYMIYLLSVHFQQIVNNHVSNSYYLFMNMFIVLFMLLFYVFYSGTQEQAFKQSGTINKLTGLTLYLLESIQIIIIITIAIILQYFSTDG